MTMHCDCGHSLRTVEEQNKGQCVRCSSKIAARIALYKWQVAGSAAYLNDIARAPLMDSGVMREIRNGGDVLSICKAWLHGWDNENLYGDLTIIL